jgi:hypothetical protein
MTRARFICLFLFFASSMFGQSNSLPILSQGSRSVSPASQSDPKAQARILDGHGKPPAQRTGSQADHGFSRLHGYKSSIQANFQSLATNVSGIFLEAPTYSSSGAESIAVADVNGDGKPDVITNNGDVLLGNGDGTFQAAVTYGAGGSCVTVADVNGDGKPDLLFAGDGVSVLLGNGDGTFQTAVNYSAAGESATSVAVADVNGDGKLDVIAVNDSGTVSVLLGNGDGTFQAAVSYPSGGEFASSVAVADVNGDGKPDLLVATDCAISNSNCVYGNGVVGVLLGNGDGTFQTVVSYDSGGWAGTAMAVADVNGDGKPDVVVANGCSFSYCGGGNYSPVSVLLGNGDGSFQAAVSYSSGGEYAVSVAVADLNGDGKPDIVVANQCVNDCSYDVYGSAGVLLGNGDGTFQTAVGYGSGGEYANSVSVGDVNGDGKPDILVVNECDASGNCGNGAIGVLLGNGDGTFKTDANYSLDAQLPYSVVASSVYVADVNADGKPDLLVAGNGVSVLLGNGDGTFQTAVNYSAGGESATSVAVADVNGDGKLDVIANNGDVLLGNGDGTFQAAVTYGAGGSCVTVADVNGDGKPDLLLITGDGVSVLLGNGDGTFQAAVSYPSGGESATSVAVGDVNGDGKPDILVANLCDISGNCQNGTVGVLLGNRDGTFQAAVTYSSGGGYASSVVMGDVNGDGKPDLVVAQCGGSNCASGSVGVLLGNGDGTFQAASQVLTPEQVSPYLGALVLADFNGDGKLDVASGAGAFLLLGNGDGTFQPYLNLGATGSGIAVGDFNRDGKPDLAVGGVAVLLNITAGFHCATTTVLTSSGNPGNTGQPVTFTATVTPAFGAGALTGAVIFYDAATPLATAAIVNGQAALNTSSLSAGTHSITASYSGDTNYLPSSSATITKTVNQASTTLKLTSGVNPSGLDQPVTFTATITTQYGGQASGTVTFKNGVTTLGSTAVNSNAASLTTSNLAMGTHTITAIYSCDGNFTGSTSNAVPQVVTKATTTTTLLSSINPLVAGKSVTFTATVSSLAASRTGTVQFLNGTTLLATETLKSGAAKYTTSQLPPGTDSITAVYSGDSNNSGGSSASVNQLVQAPTTTTLTSSPESSAYGQTVIFSAVVTSSIGPPPDGETSKLQARLDGAGNRNLEWRCGLHLSLDAGCGRQGDHGDLWRRCELH